MYENIWVFISIQTALPVRGLQSNGNSVNFTNLSISIILLPLLPLALSLEEPKPLSERHLTRFVGRCLGPELCDLLSVVTPWLGDMNRRVRSIKFDFYGLMKELTRKCRSRSSDVQSRRLAWDRVPWESGPSPIDGKIELRRDAVPRHLAYSMNASRRLFLVYGNDTPLSITLLAGHYQTPELQRA
jgi:hypothetical protein